MSAPRRINCTAHTLSQQLRAVPMRPREAARAAAEARNLNAGAESIIDRLARVDLFCPLSREIRPFQRLLDDQLLARTSRQQAIETLTNLIELVKNEEIASAGDPPRAIRLRNSKVKRTIVDVAGAVDYLLLCGFRKSVREYEEFLGFNLRTPAGLYDLKVGHHVLTVTLDRTIAAYELETIRREAAREEVEQRTARVLLQIAEDARLRREREERVRQARRAGEGGEGRAIDRNPVAQRDEWY